MFYGLFSLQFNSFAGFDGQIALLYKVIRAGILTEAIAVWGAIVAISVRMAALARIVGAHRSEALLIIAIEIIIAAPAVAALVARIALVALRWIGVIVTWSILVPSLIAT